MSMEVLSADVVIVGAGIVGGLMGDRLTRAGAKVLILDAGPVINRAEAVQRFHDIPWGGIDSPYINPPWSPGPTEEKPWRFYGQHHQGKIPVTDQMAFQVLYLKGVGGTSWHFTGHAERFQPNDFRMRTAYGRGVDWPVSYQELEEWYAEVEREWGVSGGPDTIAPPRQGPYPMPEVPLSYLDLQVRKAAEPQWKVNSYPHARNSVPGFNGRPQCCGNSSCRYICPIGAKYDGSVHVDRARSHGAWVMSERVAYDVVVDNDGKVGKIRYLKPDGSQGEAHGKLFILAAHAIETPKLMLMSTGRSSNGVGNSSGMVGRNLMCNVDVDTEAYAQAPVWPYRGPVFATGGIEGLRDGAFRKDHAAVATFICNGGFSKMARGPTDEVLNALNANMIGTALRDQVKKQAATQVHLSSSVEVLPNPANHVTPDYGRRDKVLGLPLPKVDFRIDDYTLRGCKAAAERDAAVVTNMKARITTPVDWTRPEVDYAIVGGTVRMGKDPRTSVVNEYCRSHDVPNLFVIGTANYCTQTICSPSLTAAALALRSVDHIIKNHQFSG